ncbi:MAG: (2Fe-2S) ferredoxin domain-containing protein [Chloroflexota bacterium]|nr:(2Fe-2S) ferredoxin domain-containing protein [Dehalococcoidia bacterium]MDW8253189.1 (2Fe-2S) ferredoxin domain-containing protein [Chloroflexota bacterium]
MRHVFVCTTGYSCHWPKVTAEHRSHGAHLTPEEERERMKEQPEHANGHIGRHCGEIGGGELYERFKAALAARGRRDILLSPNACIAQHIAGPVVMVYPDGIWYGRVTLDDVDEIIDRHLIGGQPVERLIWREVAAAEPAGV